MPDDTFQVDYLTDSPEGKLQYKPDNTGVTRVSDSTPDDSPSLSGPIPRYGYKGQKGIAGTEVSEELNEPSHGKSFGSTVKAVNLTPEQMLEASKRMEDDLLEKQRQLDGTTAVDAALIRSNGMDNGEIPMWLQNYMSKQAFTDPYHQVPMTPVDRIKSNKYLTEQEKLKMLRDVERGKGSR